MVECDSVCKECMKYILNWVHLVFMIQPWGSDAVSGI
jgi:hypothetical protein